MVQGQFAIADRRQQIINTVVITAFRRHAHRFRLQQAVKASFPHFPLQHHPTPQDILLPVRSLIPLPDAVLGGSRHHKADPIQTRLGTLLGNNLHNIAILQQGVQWHHSPVHLRPSTMVPHFRMNAVGKIHRRCSPCQRNHISILREDVDISLKQVIFNTLQILLGILQIVLPVQQLPQPAKLLIHSAHLSSMCPSSLLILPVGSDPILRNVVHLHRANLHLQGAAVHPNHHCM